MHIEGSTEASPGAHPVPDPEALENARSLAFPYFHEFESSVRYYDIKSPYFVDRGKKNPKDKEAVFLAEIEMAIWWHLQKYPHPLKKSPYKLEE